VTRSILIAIAAVACGPGSSSSGGEAIQLWHTFGDAETELLNATLDARKGDDVEVTRIAFARGHVVLSEILGGGDRCPDLLRIDATWLAALSHRLAAAPSALIAEREWVPEALALATFDGVARGLPQSIDGLVLIGDPAGDRIGVPIDAYWFIPYLRAAGADIFDASSGNLGIDSPVAATALDDFAALTRAGPRTAERAANALVAGELDAIVEGPWAIHGLRTAGLDIAVAPLPVAGTSPRGGQLFAVPRCSKRTEAAWQLAADLTAPEVQVRWSQALALVPTTAEALEAAPPIARALRDALASGRPLPAHPITPDLFDDLSPAIEAVVAGDATSVEALAGVERAWRRLAQRHGIAIRESSP